MDNQNSNHSSLEVNAHPLWVLRLLQEIMNVIFFVYFGAHFFKNLSIDGYPYGAYLKPIAAFPLWILVFFALAIHYGLMVAEAEKGQRLQKLTHQLGQEIQNTFLDHPVRRYITTTWKGLKLFFVRTLQYTFIGIIGGGILSVIMMLITGNHHISVHF